MSVMLTRKNKHAYLCSPPPLASVYLSVVPYSKICILVMSLRGHLEVFGEFWVGEEGTNALDDISKVHIECVSIDNNFTTAEGRTTREFRVNELIKLTDVRV
jgi:hypothetical protein